MPEMTFTLRWPDGRDEVCYSPSLVVQEFLKPGSDYRLTDLMDRCRQALTIASARVEAKYGFACSRAIGQLERLEAQAARFEPDALVHVGAFNT
ncbi:MSMEG_0570 family protein [Arboricoccus pini]|uniref:MSMEG_0570 family protein n=1 Tax=Arboricoccus pini TaxID=1963835 RepID=A0A212RKL3_9PROT|nr:MSMEG_0570 family nitrogen starvation response protein [Arboricoccus pini]SNB72999.1 MSMEG_0570 family protein [Arboricoccus pini]